MKWLILIIIFGSINSLKAQYFKLDNQWNCQFRLEKYLDTIGFVSPKEKDIDIDLRVWKINSAKGQNKLLRITKSKTEIWSAYSLDYYCYNDNSCAMNDYIIDTLSIDKSWFTNWEKITTNQWLNTETQSTVNQELNKKTDKLLIIADGTSYIFEIKIGRRKKRFHYNNPKTYYDFYQSLGIESTDYDNVIRLVNTIESSFDFSYLSKKIEE